MVLCLSPHNLLWRKYWSCGRCWCWRSENDHLCTKRWPTQMQLKLKGAWGDCQAELVRGEVVERCSSFLGHRGIPICNLSFHVCLSLLRAMVLCVFESLLTGRISACCRPAWLLWVPVNVLCVIHPFLSRVLNSRLFHCPTSLAALPEALAARRGPHT